MQSSSQNPSSQDDIDPSKSRLNIPAYVARKKNEISGLFQTMMHELVVNTPENPISFLLDSLQTPKGKYHVIIAGAPASGKGNEEEGSSKKRKRKEYIYPPPPPPYPCP